MAGPCQSESNKVREKQELDHVGLWQPPSSLDFFFPGFSGKPLKGFKQRRDGILKKTEVAKWRVDCKMGTGKQRYQVEAAIIAQER